MNHYETMQAIGRGAYGNVYLYRRLYDNKHIVIKKIPMESITKAEGELTKNEVRVLSMLQHPNIIEYYDNFIENNTMMIVMEYAPGGNLYDYLRTRGEGNLLQEEDVLNLFCQLVLGLQHIHENNILHRDIKSNNILLDRSHRIVKIGDFGISKILSSKSKAHTVVGTPCYLSPELCQEKPYNQRSDVWALGCVLYEMLALRRAFEAETLPALIMKILRGIFEPIHPHYSTEMRSLVHLLLHTDPAQRPDCHQVISHPLVFPALCRLHADLGMLRCVSRPLRLSSVGTRGRSSRGSEDSTDRERPIEEERRGEDSREKTPGGEDTTSLWREEEEDTGNEEKRDEEEEVGIEKEKRLDGKQIKEKKSERPLISTSSSVFCWTHCGTPVRLSVGEVEGDVVEVSASRTNQMAVTSHGHVVHWPNLNQLGLEGRGEQEGERSIPVTAIVGVVLKCPTSVTVVQAACGDGFMACVTDRGILLTMGDGLSGSLGHGDTSDVGRLRMVESLLGVAVAEVACGARHILARSVDGDVYAWGCGIDGRLGVGTRTTQLQPRPVELPESCGMGETCSELEMGQVVGLAAGEDSSILITSSGQLLAAGSNRHNKVCVDETDAAGRETLKHVEGVATFVPVCSQPLVGVRVAQVTLGPSHSLFLTDGGEVWSSGDDTHGQLGHRASLAVPHNLRSPARVDLHGAKAVKVVCGANFSLAVTTAGEVYSWGGREKTSYTSGENKEMRIASQQQQHQQQEAWLLTNAYPAPPNIAFQGTISTTSTTCSEPVPINLGEKLKGRVSMAVGGDYVLLSHRP
ncbi:hypothetical protein Pcinc_030134 [Petrolisthes cinctipes]|uniref:non-specific serine/threonine protein kinase n=1 Tax=Petrolisthes cinctipes TaxID=88211 RepID=A0AAE1EZD0_PETCI|nr:hypothetical protein Pcinc_030134 [Petrolisthes cinctipes]